MQAPGSTPMDARLGSSPRHLQTFRKPGCRLYCNHPSPRPLQPYTPSILQKKKKQKTIASLKAATAQTIHPVPAKPNQDIPSSQSKKCACGCMLSRSKGVSKPDLVENPSSRARAGFGLQQLSFACFLCGIAASRVPQNPGVVGCCPTRSAATGITTRTRAKFRLFDIALPL